MVERWLLAFLARARGSKGGIALIIVGVLVLLSFLVFGLVSVAGNALLVLTGAGPVLAFLGTGPGVLMGFVVSVLLILLGVAFLNRATPQPTQSLADVQQAGPAQSDRDREVEQLQRSFRRVQQERDRLRTRLSDPTAMRRLEDERLRRRCLEVAHEIENFMRIGDYVDPNELVARFRQRHEWKVNELRNRLDEQAWLTPQERDALTFHADDYSHKIYNMETTLRAIGMGH